jgi:hypothetical protein
MLKELALDDNLESNFLTESHSSATWAAVLLKDIQPGRKEE